MKKLLYLLLPILFLCVCSSSSLAKTTALFLSDTTIYQTFSICEGDSVVVGNSVYTEAGVYQDVLQSSQAEDSIVITNIILFSPQILLPQTIRVCSDEALALEIMPRALQRAYSTVVGTPLPDGIGIPVDIPFFVNSFAPGQEIQLSDDVREICLSIEHSWMHDLDIALICPSGQSVLLQDQQLIGSNIFLGEPYQLDDSNTPDPPHPGIGWNYCWSEGAAQTLTQYSLANPGADVVPEGYYRPAESFANLIGCPLNGPWIIRITDLWAQDNGWAFEGAIDFQVSSDSDLNFLWSTGETTPSVTVNETGVYSVTVTTASGCTISDSTEVLLQPAQIVALPNENQFIALPAGASSYQWYKNGEPIIGAIQQTFFHNDIPGLYTVKVVLHGVECLSPPFQILDFQGQQSSSDCVEATPLCNSISVGFSTVSPNAINDFEDPDNQQGCLIDGEINPRWYRFSFKEDMPPGSLFELDITSDFNPVNFNFAIYGPGASCDNLGEPVRCSNAATLTSTGLSQGASDTSEGASGDGFVAPLAVEPGQQYYLLLNANYLNHHGFQVTVGGSAAAYLDCTDDFCPIWVSLGSDRDICYEQAFRLDSIALSAPQNATYEWIGRYGENVYLDNEATLTPLVTLPSGFSSGDLDYTLVVRSGNCAVADDVKISVRKTAASGIAGDAAFCADAFTTLSVDGTLPLNTEYLWSTGSTGASIDVAESGVYTVAVWDGSGCGLRDTIQVVELAPEITLNPDNGLLNLIAPLPGTTYQWYVDNQEILGATDTSFHPSSNGLYQIIVSYMGISCLSNHLLVTDIDETKTALGRLEASPNPTDGKVNIESTLPMEHLLILNAYGQRINELRGAGQTRLPLDFSVYPSGVYWIVVRMENEVQTLKIVVAK